LKGRGLRGTVGSLIGRGFRGTVGSLSRFPE